MTQLALTLPFAAAEEGGGNPLVEVSPGLMIWTLLAFAAAMIILSKFAFPRISKLLEDRQRMIESTIDASERTKAEAEALLAEYRERLKEARVQAEEIVARARKAAEAHERESLEAARKQREDLLEQARRDIEAETHRAIQEIRAEVADLTALGAHPVVLGPEVLRTSTAGAVALGAIGVLTGRWSR